MAAVVTDQMLDTGDLDSKLDTKSITLILPGASAADKVTFACTGQANRSAC